MRCDIRSGHVNLQADLRDYIQERINRSLGRVSSRISRITCHLDDVNGPKGGADKRCLVEAHLLRSGHIVTDVTAGDIRTAVDLAAERLAHRVQKELGRRRESRRQFSRRSNVAATV